MSAGGGSVFVDTNVPLYSLRSNEASKQRAAREWMATLWDHESGRISWQVIHEFYSNAVGKLKVPRAYVRAEVEDLLKWDPEPTQHATVLRAWHWCDSAQLNYWDALIVASAEQAGCRWLLSEDFQPGRRFGMVTVINPFEHEPREFDLE